MIDLLSDTITRPTPGMREAMASAEVGDDVFGEDPSVNRLEATVALLFGREASVFVPSGTMANQIAIRVHTRPGDEAIVGRWAHSYLYEVGGASALSGVQLTAVGTDGLFTAADVEPEIKPNSIHCPQTRLIMFENTHNRGGGRIFPLEHLKAISALARDRGIKTHMDGARLMNAVMATGIGPEVYGGLVDTVSLCLSKGLGAPVGSMLVGDAETIERARRVRKQLGGAMRQAGILAAAGLYALQHQLLRLVEDHRHAGQLAAGLKHVPGVTVKTPETNIVMLELTGGAPDADAVVADLLSKGVRLYAMAPRLIRAVFSLEVSAVQTLEALGKIREALLARPL